MGLWFHCFGSEADRLLFLQELEAKKVAYLKVTSKQREKGRTQGQDGVFKSIPRTRSFLLGLTYKIYHFLIAYQTANPWLRSEPGKVLLKASNDLSSHLGPAGTSMWEAVILTSSRVMLRYLRGPTSSWGAGNMLHIV